MQVDFNNIRSGMAAIVSITSAGMGTAMEFIVINITSIELNTYLEQGAWVVAIMAGIVSVINGTRNWFRKNGKRKASG